MNGFDFGSFRRALNQGEHRSNRPKSEDTGLQVRLWIGRLFRGFLELVQEIVCGKWSEWMNHCNRWVGYGTNELDMEQMGWLLSLARTSPHPFVVSVSHRVTLLLLYKLCLIKFISITAGVTSNNYMSWLRVVHIKTHWESWNLVFCHFRTMPSPSQSTPLSDSDNESRPALNASTSSTDLLNVRVNQCWVQHIQVDYYVS